MQNPEVNRGKIHSRSEIEKKIRRKIAKMFKRSFFIKHTHIFSVLASNCVFNTCFNTRQLTKTCKNLKHSNPNFNRQSGWIAATSLCFTLPNLHFELANTLVNAVWSVTACFKIRPYRLSWITVPLRELGSNLLKIENIRH